MASMRFFYMLQIVTCLLIAGCSAHTQSGQTLIWGQPQVSSVHNVLEKTTDISTSAWAGPDWNPQGWIDSRGGSAKAVIEGFYSAGIVTDQYFKRGTPVLEVGQKFLELSREDKHRVCAFIDTVFGVTAQGGVFMIEFDKYYNVPVGVFTAQGLQLQ
jgi:hypothetical protein